MYVEDGAAGAVPAVVFDVLCPGLAPDGDGHVSGRLCEPHEDEGGHVALLVDVREEVGWEPCLGIHLYRANQVLVTVILRTRDKRGHSMWTQLTFDVSLQE